MPFHHSIAAHDLSSCQQERTLRGRLPMSSIVLLQQAAFCSEQDVKDVANLEDSTTTLLLYRNSHTALELLVLALVVAVDLQIKKGGSETTLPMQSWTHGARLSHLVPAGLAPAHGVVCTALLHENKCKTGEGETTTDGDG